MFQQNFLPNESIVQCRINSTDVSIRDNNFTNAAPRYVGLVDNEQSRYIKEEEYSACVALLGMAASPNQQVQYSAPSNNFDVPSQLFTHESLTNRDASQDFFDFFPHYNRLDTNEEKSSLLQIKKEPAETEECFRKFLIDHGHDYFLKVEPEEDRTEQVDPFTILKSDRIVENPNKLYSEEISSNTEVNDSAIKNIFDLDSCKEKKVDSEMPEENAISLLEDITSNTDLDLFKAAYNSYPGNNQTGMDYSSQMYSDYDPYYYQQQYNYGNYENGSFGHFYENKIEHPNLCNLDGNNGVRQQIDAYSSNNNYGLVLKNEENFNVMPLNEINPDIENKENLEPNSMTDEEMQKLNAKYTHQRFPIKLWNLASDHEFKAIEWSSDGTSLIIDEVVLEPSLGYFFRSKKFSSFLRQLHLYGFRKVTRARCRSAGGRLNDDKTRVDFISEYQCQHFQRDRFDLVKNVRRFYSSNTQITKSTSTSPTSELNIPVQFPQPPTSIVYSVNSEDNHMYHYYQNGNNQQVMVEEAESSRSSIGGGENNMVYYHQMNDSCSLMDYQPDNSSSTASYQSIVEPSHMLGPYV